MKTPSFWLGAFSHFLFSFCLCPLWPDLLLLEPDRTLSVSDPNGFAIPRLASPFPQDCRGCPVDGARQSHHNSPVWLLSAGVCPSRSDTDRPVCTGLDHCHFFYWWLGWPVPTSVATLQPGIMQANEIKSWIGSILSIYQNLWDIPRNSIKSLNLLRKKAKERGFRRRHQSTGTPGRH